MSAATVEDRLIALEKKVDLLLQRLAPANGDWTRQVIGSFKDCPEFDEVLRLGREFRKNYIADDVADDEFEDNR
ncbi:MAG TPA: hypothetical protein VGI40_21135 [Pirellulaceae bacterium]|jgi:hypothetical protein